MWRLHNKHVCVILLCLPFSLAEGWEWRAWLTSHQARLPLLTPQLPGGPGANPILRSHKMAFELLESNFLLLRVESTQCISECQPSAAAQRKSHFVTEIASHKTLKGRAFLTKFAWQPHRCSPTLMHLHHHLFFSS